jgi:hypothetical protein
VKSELPLCKQLVISALMGSGQPEGELGNLPLFTKSINSSLVLISGKNSALAASSHNTTPNEYTADLSLICPNCIISGAHQTIKYNIN